LNASQDGFVAKVAPDGSALVYSTYLGAQGNTVANDVAVGADGRAVVIGDTQQFPTTPGAFDETPNDFEDGFVAKLSPAGSSLDYATYLGGSDCDLAQTMAVEVDADGSAYVVGYTSADDFPTTPGAFDTTAESCGFADGFVTKLNPSGSALDYSTFLSGVSNESDVAFGIDVDADGNAYVTGATQSPDFPTTTAAYDSTHNGHVDAYVTKLNAVGSDLVFSTFLGGGGPENGTAITVHEGGDVFIAGGTSSDDFPTTPGAFDESHNGSDDAILARLDASGSTLLYATHFGGSGQDYGLWGLAVDAGGRALFSGYTNSSDLPMSPNAFDSTYGGGEHQQDGWIAKIATEEPAPSATERIGEARSRLESLTTPRNADKLEDVVEKLEKALAKLAQSPPDRQGAAGELEGAVGDIEAAVRSRLLSRADGEAVMTEIAEAAGLLAEDAIADAQGGNAAKLAEAEAALAAGDSRLVAGQFKAAVAMYKDAISKADGA
jgi:hypothetical protein